MTKTCKQVLVVLTLGLVCSFGLFPGRAAAQYENSFVSYNDFYQNLAPYGQWIEDPQYGFVWSPNVDGSFRPYYTNGYWVMTDYGNTWISDYPWGWACFHYGRWTYDSYYGWIWIPGANWGPSWVCWRYSDGYYGWAPLGPGYDFGSSVDYYCPNDWWVFIPPKYLYSGNYYRYWYGPRGNSHIIHNTTIINNTYSNNTVTYVSGPHVKQVELATHQPVQVFKVSASTNLNTRVHNNEVRMYRPSEIRPAVPVNGEKVAPPNVVSAPQPIKKTPQSINAAQTNTPPFREDIPHTNGHFDATGTNITETATPPPPANQQHQTRPYEWDVNKSVPQPPKPEPAPQPAPKPAPKPVKPQQGRPQQQGYHPPVQQQPRPQAQPQPQAQPRPAPPREENRK